MLNSWQYRVDETDGKKLAVVPSAVLGGTPLFKKTLDSDVERPAVAVIALVTVA